MKIRNGFVSNSSSSSFIIGIGTIENEERFDRWREKFKDTWQINIIKYPPGEGENPFFFESGLEEDSDYYYVSAPINRGDKDIHLAKTNCVGKKIAIIELGNNEGDSDFWIQTGKSFYEGYLKHNIDLDWFPEEQQRLYNTFNKRSAGVTNVEKLFGAGRNG